MIILATMYHWNQWLYFYQLLWGMGFTFIQIPVMPYILRNSIASNQTGAISLSAGIWYNLVFTYNNSSYLKQIYVNSVFDTSGGTVAYGGTGTNTELGRYPWAPSYLLNGNIAIVSFYNKVLSANEILQNYNIQKGRFGL
jgi:hypothetical protein